MKNKYKILIISLLFLAFCYPFFQKKISGAIVPHHLLVPKIIDGVFRRIALQNPKTIVIIGPNHKELGTSPVIMGNSAEENAIIANEHSIQNIIPFAKKYIPGAGIKSVILKRALSVEDLGLLATKLAQIDDAVFVVSTDFSHYLKSSQAQINDKVTEQLIRNKDYVQILKLSNDFIDSPPSVVLLLMIMEKLKTEKFDILEHTNSGILTGNTEGSTTSYFSMVYY